MKTQFNSKETYLAYRSEWKATYKQISHNIRTLRYAHNALQRPSGKDLPGDAKHIENAKKILNHTGPLYNCTFLYAKQRLSAQATCMLEELAQAKVEAQVQYLAAHAIHA